MIRVSSKKKSDIYRRMKKFNILVCFLFCVVPSIVSCSSKHEGKDAPVMMLRLRPTNTDSDQSWNETFTIIKDNPGCCDEVWFSTGMGYLPEEWQEDKV